MGFLEFVLAVLLIPVLGDVVVGAAGAGVGALVFRKARATRIGGIVGGLLGFLLAIFFFY